jgi:hypothetical protein
MSPCPPYPKGVPWKFSPEGLVQRYPGNTTVCHIPAKSSLIPSLQVVYEALAAHPILSKKIHLLPPTSWHMTVLDGVREQKCEPGMRPGEKEKQRLADCTAEFAARLRQIGPELEKEGLHPPYRMRVRSFGKCVVGIGLEVEGATLEEEQRMRRLRDRLADDGFRFRAPNHDSYHFHISMAYLLRYIEGEEREELNKVLTQLLPEVQQEFELGAVEFCTFENMYAFPRQFFLGKGEE